MNEEIFNLEMRKFLKNVGVTSQREIERAVMAALETGMLSGTEKLNAIMTLEIPALGVTHRVDGTLALEKA
jgi:hypothetical protein